MQNELQTQTGNKNLCVKLQQKQVVKPILLLFEWEFKRAKHTRTHTHIRTYATHSKQNAIIVHNDIGLEAIIASWRFTEKPNTRFRFVGESAVVRVHCSVASCFIHNNLCYCVFRERGHHFVLLLFWFDSVLLVASMRWMNESRMRCMCVCVPEVFGELCNSPELLEMRICVNVSIAMRLVFEHVLRSSFRSIAMPLLYGLFPLYINIHTTHLCVLCAHAFFVPNLVFEAKYFGLTTHKFVM